jgi:multisubunit Na+/H+ antiporter MnhB subunit
MVFTISQLWNIPTEHCYLSLRHFRAKVNPALNNFRDYIVRSVSSGVGFCVGVLPVAINHLPQFVTVYLIYVFKARGHVNNLFSPVFCYFTIKLCETNRN